MTITYLIIIATAAISIITFSNAGLYDKLILWPKKMDSPAEYYRLLTSGFIHADWMHLIFNMMTLYFFGGVVETYFTMMGVTYAYPVMYLLAIIVSSVPSFLKNRHNSYYRSLGASGGVAAVLFSSVYFDPWAKIYIFFVPAPAIIFAIVYLIYCAYMDKRGGTNINHGAHFWGSVFGFISTLLLDPTHGQIFVQQIMPR